mmetsp:Transcript_26805/g.65681  ORF Transcript_26805/g.65681 Transcript_26805/m.65681 type:complete len:967 (-) Transcript_26805:374-3274(-)
MGRPLGDLLVAAQVETVLEVLQRGVLDGLLEMVHGVLGDVRQPQVVVLPHLAHLRVRLQLADQDLHQRRLARAVQPHKRRARALRDLHVGRREDALVRARVLEGHVLHVHDHLLARFDAVERAGVGEADGLDVRRRLAARRHGVDGVHGLGHLLLLLLLLVTDARHRGHAAHGRHPGHGRDLLHSAAGHLLLVLLDGGLLLNGVVRRRQRRHNLGLQRLEVPEAHGVVREGLVAEVDDVREHLGEKVVVVRHQADGGLGEGAQVAHQPRDGGGVQVVRGLVQQQHLGVPQHGAGDGQLHAPASGEGLDGGRHLDVVEAHLAQGAHHRLAGHAGGHHLHHEIHNGLLLLAQNLVQNVVDGDVRGETGDVLGRHAVEQRGLAGAVLAHDAVRVPALQAEVGALQQHAPGERQDDALQVHDEVRLVQVVERLGVQALVVQHRRLRRHGAVRVGHLSLQHGHELALHVVGQDGGRDAQRRHVDHPPAEGRGVRRRLVVQRRGAVRLERHLHALGRDLALHARLGIHALHQPRLGLRGALTQVGVGVLLALLQLGLERGDEGVEVAHVVHQRADVPARHRRLLLDVHGALAQPAHDHGQHHGERGRVHGVDEGGLHQLVQARLRLQLRVADRVDDEVEHADHLGVLDAGCDGHHHVPGDGGHLGVGVEHALQERREDLGQGAHEVGRHALGQVAADAQGAHLGLPRLGHHGGGERGRQQLHRCQGQRAHHGGLRGVRGVPHVGALVALEDEHGGGEADGEGLEGAPGGAAHVCVQRAAAGASHGVLLGGQGLGDCGHDAELADGGAAHAVDDAGDAGGARAALHRRGALERLGHQLAHGGRVVGAKVVCQLGQRRRRNVRAVVAHHVQRLQDALQRGLAAGVTRGEPGGAVAVEGDDAAADVVLLTVHGRLALGDVGVHGGGERGEQLRLLALAGVAGQRGARHGDARLAHVLAHVAQAGERHGGHGGGAR